MNNLKNGNMTVGVKFHKYNLNFVYAKKSLN